LGRITEEERDVEFSFYRQQNEEFYREQDRIKKEKEAVNIINAEKERNERHNERLAKRRIKDNEERHNHTYLEKEIIRQKRRVFRIYKLGEITAEERKVQDEFYKSQPEEFYRERDRVKTEEAAANKIKFKEIRKIKRLEKYRRLKREAEQPETAEQSNKPKKKNKRNRHNNGRVKSVGYRPVCIRPPYKLELCWEW